MKSLLEVCLVALTFVAGTTHSGIAQPSAAAADAGSFARTWEGRMNDLPGMKLQIEEAQRKISGEAVFYLQQRDDESSPWHIAGQHVERLLFPHVEGKTLTFEVQHDRCHGCPELGPNVRFRMDLTGANEAQISNFDQGSDSRPGMILVRQTEARDSSAPPMQQGISVKLPITRYARSMPDADQPDSLIVSVTADGNAYFGIDPITPTTLAEKLKAVSGQTEKKLYVKADARTSYVHVLKILDVIEAAGIREPALLTAQPEVVKPGTQVPPKGLVVLVGAPLVASSRPAVIELVYSPQGSPALKINGQNIPLRSLESRLRQYLNPQTQKVVLLEADGQLPFARVVDVAGRCRAAGAKVVLHTDAEKASATEHGAMMRGSAPLGTNG